MDNNDSMLVKALASLCPYTNGNVVFMAQAMYRILYQDYTTQFDNNCIIDTSSRPSPPAIMSAQSEQSYQLFPNPNDGYFTLMQAVVDENPVQVTVTDMIGKQMFSQSYIFNQKQIRVGLGNLPNGAYLLQAKDLHLSGNLIYFKFVIIK
jgi:hypothetical protein